jgi:hypothetical protein
MSKPIPRLTPSQAPRLVNGLRATLNFIRSNIPADVIATKQTRGLERATAALKLKPNTNKNVSELGTALIWAFVFVTENYRGNAVELVDAIKLLQELGFLDVERTPIHPDHRTRQ